eukprot:1096923_1
MIMESAMIRRYVMNTWLLVGVVMIRCVGIVPMVKGNVAKQNIICPFFHIQDPLDQLSLFDELMVAPSEKQAACVPEILDTLQCHVIGIIFNTSIMVYVEENQSLLFDEHLTAVIPHCSFADGVHDVFDISHYNAIGILLLSAKVYVMELCINDALYVDLNDSKTDVIWIDKS